MSGADSASSGAVIGSDVALGYEPPPGRGEESIWIPAGGYRRIGGLNETRKASLLSQILELRALRGTRLVVLGTEVGELGSAGRAALRARFAFLPAAGGLLSSLNAWENITLPLGFHDPGGLPGATARVYRLLEELGADPHELLPKLPERMSLREKKLTGYVRILIENPDLVLVDDLGGGLDPEEQAVAARFPRVYQANRPGGTFVQLEGAAEARDRAGGRSPELS